MFAAVSDALLRSSTLALVGPGENVVTRMVGGICNMLAPFVGQDSKMLSLIFLISFGAIILMWFLNENKEGLIIWALRAGVALGILMNIFTLPQLFGLPGVCGG